MSTKRNFNSVIASFFESYKVTLIILISAFIAYIGYSWIMTPQINSNPQKKIVMRGVFPFDRGWDLKLRQSFYTKNPECKRTARAFLIFPAAKVSRSEQAPFISVKRLDNSGYEVEYFEDYFLPGYCDWVAGFTHYNIVDNGKFVKSAALLGFPHIYNRIDFDCSEYDMPKSLNKFISCSEGNNRSLDKNIQDGQVNFIWKDTPPQPKLPAVQAIFDDNCKSISDDLSKNTLDASSVEVQQGDKKSHTINDPVKIKSLLSFIKDNRLVS